MDYLLKLYKIYFIPCNFLPWLRNSNFLQCTFTDVAGTTIASHVFINFIELNRRPESRSSTCAKNTNTQIGSERRSGGDRWVENIRGD